MLKALFLRLIALTAVFSSLLLAVWTGKQLRWVFELTDPSGLFGVYFTPLAFLSNVFVVFFFIILVFRGIRAKSFRDKVPFTFTFMFCLKIFEAFNLLPCIARSNDMCSISIMLSYVTSPLIIFVAMNYIFRTEDVPVKRAGFTLAALLVFCCAAAWWQITPKKADDCLLYPKITAQGACQQRFAIASHDIAICHQILYRPVRYECMRLIAHDRRKPELCEQIQTPQGAEVLYYEVTAESYRDACYHQLAIDLNKSDLCGKILDADQKKECLDNPATKSPAGK